MDGLLARLPCNMNFYYQLEQIPEDQRDSALQTVLEHRNGRAVTAKVLEQWRKNSKAVPAHAASLDEMKVQTSEDMATMLEYEPPVAEMSEKVEGLEMETQSEPVQVPSVTVHSDEKQDTTVDTVPSDDALFAEKISDTFIRWEAGKEIDTFEDYIAILIGILKDVEFQRLVGDDAIRHSKNRDLKPGESTVREHIDEAIDDFKKGVNEAQVPLLHDQRLWRGRLLTSPRCKFATFGRYHHKAVGLSSIHPTVFRCVKDLRLRNSSNRWMYCNNHQVR